MNPLLETAIEVLKPLSHAEQSRSERRVRTTVLGDIQLGRAVGEDELVSLVLTMGEYGKITALLDALQEAKR